MTDIEHLITLTVPLQVFRGLEWVGRSGEYDSYEANQMEEWTDGLQPGWQDDWQAASQWMRDELGTLMEKMDPAYEIYRICDGTRHGIFRAAPDAVEGDLWTLEAARNHCTALDGVPALEYLDTVYDGDPEAPAPPSWQSVEQQIAHLKLRIAILEEQQEKTND